MPRRILQGVVVSDKADKTITVLVERRIMHPIYKKFVKNSKKYLAHDETKQAKLGQTVDIIECRPISKRKKWMLVGGAEIGTAKPVEKAVKAPVKKEAKKKVAKAK
ncbi:MAG: 30S ribosomal protein S17 [Alphaproteobacteria bacterium]|nr:30S ribosomal protein S17 [Alphaproteobacteria bacterium]